MQNKRGEPRIKRPRRSGAGWRFELRILGFLESAISFPNSENSPLEGQVIVQSAATSSEVRFSTAALDEFCALLGGYATRQAALLPRCAIAPMLRLNRDRYHQNRAEAHRQTYRRACRP